MAKNPLNILKKPVPGPHMQTWKAALISAAIIFLLFEIFRPFGLQNMPALARLSFSLYFAAATFAGVFFPGLLYILFFPKNYAGEDNWTLGKEILHNFLILCAISFCIWLATRRYMEPGIRSLVEILGDTVIIGLFPITAIHMIIANMNLKRNLREAEKINALLSSRQPVPEDRSGIAVLQDGTKDSFTLNSSDLLFAKAELNYINIVYLDRGRIESRMIRSTMKQAEAALEAFPAIRRCHRTYLLNVSKITRIDGNSQGYRAVLENCETTVPISRQYLSKLEIRPKN